MGLYDKIKSVYAELKNEDFAYKGCIELRDDGDGVQYIYRWDYSKPIPDGLKLGK